MRRAMIPALLLVLVSVVLGATVFREQVAHAAASLNVFVTNDSSHPVPVHEQGTTTTLFDGTCTSTQVQIDTSHFGAVRVFAVNLSDRELLMDIFVGGLRFDRLDVLPPTPVTITYDVPPTQLGLECDGGDLRVVVWGRP